MPTLLQVCESYIGIKENPPRSNRTILGQRFGLNGVAWCGISVAMAFHDAGMDLKKVLTTYPASTVAIMNAGKKKGWFKSPHEAKPCDIVCYHMPGGRKGVNHVGIVKSVTATGIWAYEGNTSQAGSQYAGGAYLLKFRPWSLMLGVVRVPFADHLGYTDTTPPPYVPPVNQGPVQPGPKLPDRQALVVFNTGRLVEIAQWEMIAVSGCHIDAAELPSPEHPAIYGGTTKQAVYNMGRILGKNWDGNWIAQEQWNVIDFLYLLKGHQPVLS